MNQLFATLKQGIRKRYNRNFGPYRDVVVVSYPKSGRTWLRVMLNDLNIVPTYSHDGTQHGLATPHHQLSTDKSPFQNNRVVFMVRDPRDTVVSAYFQVTKRHQTFDGSLSDFIRDERFGIEKILRFHQIWHENRSVPNDFTVVRYEDLHEAPLKTMRSLMDFLGRKNATDQKLQGVIDFYQFNNMQKLEREGYFKKTFKGVLAPKDANDPNTYKTRKGKVGGYRENMSGEDAAFCREIMQNRPNPFYPIPASY